MNTIEITELLSDGIGPELETSAHTVAEALPVNIGWDRVDWSLETRDLGGTLSTTEFTDVVIELIRRRLPA